MPDVEYTELKSFRRFPDCQAAQEASTRPGVGRTDYSIRPVPIEAEIEYTPTIDGGWIVSIPIRWKFDKKPTITLPNWTWKDMTNKEKLAFNRFRDDLKVHEEGHLSIAESILEERTVVLEGERGRTKNQALDKWRSHFRTFEQETYNLIDLKFDEYDAVTSHGAHQSRGPSEGFPGGNDVLLDCQYTPCDVFNQIHKWNVDVVDIRSIYESGASHLFPLSNDGIHVEEDSNFHANFTLSKVGSTGFPEYVSWQGEDGSLRQTSRFRETHTSERGDIWEIRTTSRSDKHIGQATLTTYSAEDGCRFVVKLPKMRMRTTYYDTDSGDLPPEIGVIDGPSISGKVDQEWDSGPLVVKKPGRNGYEKLTLTPITNL